VQVQQQPTVLEGDVGRTIAAAEDRGRKVKVVKGWAAAGIFFVALQIYVYGSWITSDHFERTPAGPTPLPGWMKVLLQFWQWGGLAFALGLIYWYVVRPLRRNRKMSSDGLLCLAFLTLFWQNSLISYFNISLTWNAFMINYGGWELKIPGWLAPRANHTAEPFVTLPPMYIYFMFFAVVIGCQVMNLIKKRWPNLGKFGLSMAAFGAFMVFDTLLEPLLMASGVWTYPGAIKGLTLYHGNYWQFPIYEAVLFGGCWAAWCCLRYFKNDKGHTVVERGVEELRASPKAKTWLRFFAIAGFLNVTMVLYSVIWAIFGLYSSPWPEDITKRSYLTNTLCGAGTSYACPGPRIPIPRRESVHVSPDGRLVEPE
jgi:hypothetical protein